MSGFELVAGVIGAFFAIGIAVGVLLVIALSQLRRHRHSRKYMDGGDWREPPGSDEDDRAPRWPGS